MKDLFTIGLISGLAGGAVMNILDYFSYYWLHFSKTRYLDFAAVLIYGNRPGFWWETVFAQLAQLIFASFLGIIFIYLLKLISTRDAWFKGIFFAETAWFLIYVIVIFFQVPFLKNFPWQSATSNVISVMGYGLVLALVDRALIIKYFGKQFWEGN